MLAERTYKTDQERQRALAANLINTKHAPVGFDTAFRLAAEANAYHTLTPYPWWAFREWRIEERGPYPVCMPFVRAAVQRSARWLFGKPIQINCAENEDWQTYLREAWVKNKMRTQLRGAAEQAGIQGGYCLKFSYDENRQKPGLFPLRFQVLSSIDAARLYYDPHDAECLLMARIQYPYWEPSEGCWYLYREEWTAEEEVHYRPVKARWVKARGLSNDGRYSTIDTLQVAVVDNGAAKPDEYEKWEIVTQAKNPFGVIPVHPVKNMDCGGVWGIGDFWGLFRVADRVNLTYQMLDKGNQFDSQANVFFIDLEIDQQQAKRALQPGESASVKSEGEKQGTVQQIEPQRRAAQIQIDYAKDLRKMALAAASNIEVDQAEFTNKGNLTQAVLSQLYAPLIELTDDKREAQGENGIGKFLELVAIGLKNLAPSRLSELAGVKLEKEETYNVELQYAPYFALTEEEKAAAVGRYQEETLSGFLPKERAAKRVAQLEGFEDIDAYLAELEAEESEAEAKAKAEMEAISKNERTNPQIVKAAAQKEQQDA